MRIIISPMVIVFLLVVCASCSRSTYIFSDIDTGVTHQGKTIIIADRDLGASAPGENGTYFTWKQANRSCPRGYRLLTVGEAQAIMADGRYDTAGKLVLGELKLVQSGYGKYSDRKEPPQFHSVGEWADYHLYEEFDKKDSWYMSFDIIGQFFGVDYLNKRDLLTVRCVKGTKPIDKAYKLTQEAQ